MRAHAGPVHATDGRADALRGATCHANLCAEVGAVAASARSGARGASPRSASARRQGGRRPPHGGPLTPLPSRCRPRRRPAPRDERPSLAKTREDTGSRALRRRGVRDFRARAGSKKEHTHTHTHIGGSRSRLLLNEARARRVDLPRTACAVHRPPHSPKGSSRQTAGTYNMCVLRPISVLPSCEVLPLPNHAYHISEWPMHAVGIPPPCNRRGARVQRAPPMLCHVARSCAIVCHNSSLPPHCSVDVSLHRLVPTTLAQETVPSSEALATFIRHGVV